MILLYFNFNPIIGIFGDLEYQIDPKVCIIHRFETK